jgi:hypothetical protein
MEKFALFYSHLEYITTIWYIIWSIENLMSIWYIFPCFGILCQEKSGNLGRETAEIGVTKNKTEFTVENNQSRFFSLPSSRNCTSDPGP